MKKTKFVYDVSAEMEISGRELWVLQHVAGAHYDRACNRAFVAGGFGFGWVNTLLWQAEEETGARSRDLKIFLDTRAEVQVTPRQLGLVLKILEMAPTVGQNLDPDFAKMLGFDETAQELRESCVELLRDLHEQHAVVNDMLPYRGP